MPSQYARYLCFAVLCLALTLPFGVVNHTYPIPTFYAEYSALALYLALGATVALLVRVSEPRVSFASPVVALMPLAFGVLLIAQTVLLPVSQPSMNWLGGAYLLASFIAVHTGYGLVRAGLSEKALRIGAAALMAGGSFAVFCQIVQLLHLEVKFTPFVVAYNVMAERRPFGNMAQANHLATVIAFAMAGALYFVQTRRLPVIVWLALTAVFSLGHALTVSRGPWLQMAVIVVAGFWMAFVQGRPAVAEGFDGPGRRDLRAWLMPVVLALVFFAVNAAVRWANVRFHFDLAQSAAERMQDANQIAPRLALWKYGWTMFHTHPILGVGWGEFPRYQFDMVRELGGVEIANNAHDIFIDLLAKTGALGLGILVLGFVFWLIRVLRAPQTPARIFGLSLLGVLLMHALVEYPQQYMFFLMPAMLVIGLLETRPLRLVAKPLSFGVYVVLVVGGLAALYPVMLDYHRAEVLYYGSRPAEQYRDDPSFLFTAWGEYGAATLVPINAQNLEEKLAMHRKAIALLPGETVLRRYAVLQALAGQRDEALDTMAKLKIFATQLHDWPKQLASVYQLIDETGKPLASFKADLVKLYGEPGVGGATADDDDDDE
ncbi:MULTISPECIES: Wzy polymerase domain-containing protein [unclassified Caballeronia]|uniref:PglL family O-oligosaccharyltransferase n=1 Tax=unclassified Caballeronia TaxID=2646786 RepID=UPI00286610B9|nr:MULTISPECIES: Wzy polymerase domain-containing protein [unclassified Caballeronia]MDR5770621.1 Wzy polymerase domain-containing protein [Caballeronia sp. LZ002]MDR5846058.1 Wzy polymerase domain-containing protein [Caballeronia sp. LZ003]